MLSWLNGFQTCNALQTMPPLYKQMTEIAIKETQDPQTMATWRQGRLPNREVSKNQRQPG